jgi:hypothetical protein
VRYLILVSIALVLGLLQYGPLARLSFPPDLLLAYAAWAMVDGTEDGVLMRAWLIGMVADGLDPGSDTFHAIGFLALALVYLPVRDLIFRTRFTGWAGWAAICALVLALADGWLAGFGEATAGRILGQVALTALLAMGIGWLFGGLPMAVQPVGKGGA